MTEKKQIIKLVTQLRDEAVRCREHLEAINRPKTEFELRTIFEYKLRENIHAELLGMLESGQSLENFIDDEDDLVIL